MACATLRPGHLSQDHAVCKGVWAFHKAHALSRAKAVDLVDIWGEVITVTSLARSPNVRLRLEDCRVSKDIFLLVIKYIS